MPGLEKLVLIGNFPPDRQESMARFTRLLADGFTARGVAVETWTPQPHFTRMVREYRYGGLPKYLGYLDKFVAFPREIRRLLRDSSPGAVFHITDHANAVYAPRFVRRPLIVTVHDLLQIRSALGEFPQNRIGRSGRRYQAWILRHLSRLNLAVCVSQKTQDDLVRLAGLAPGAAPVVHSCLNYPYSPMPPAEAAPLLGRVFARHQAALPPRYLIAVGGAQWYKNRSGLIKIFAAFRRRASVPRALVLVGPGLDAGQHELIARHRLAPHVIRVSGLDNEELRAAYSLADALLFPSWEEGFGWPVAEAQACGCPVFASGRAPMTEVGGDAARYFDPADPESAAALIDGALSVSGKELREASRRHADRWIPAPMFDAYENLYRRALQSA